MPINKRQFSTRITMAILAGLALLWLQPVRAEQTVTVPVQPRIVTVPVLTLTLRPDTMSINAGDAAQLVMTLANTGDGDATNALLNLTVPNGVHVLSSTGNGSNWVVGTVPAGGTKTISILIITDQNSKTGDGVLTAQVSADGLGAVTATSMVTIRKERVKGATTDGADTALTVLPATGGSPSLVWSGSVIFMAGLIGLFLLRGAKVRGV